MNENVKLEFGRDYKGLEETEVGYQFNVRTSMIPEILSGYDTFYRHGQIDLGGMKVKYAMIIFGVHPTLLDTWVVELLVPEAIMKKYSNDKQH